MTAASEGRDNMANMGGLFFSIEDPTGYASVAPCSPPPHTTRRDLAILTTRRDLAILTNVILNSC